jgi:hypothetical protein
MINLSWFYSLPTSSIESKRVSLSMIFCHIKKLMMNLSHLSPLDLGSMLPRHKIKSYGLIECDKSYHLTDVNDEFTMVIFLCYWVLMRNQELILSLSNGDLKLYSLILSFYLNTVFLSSGQRWWYFHSDKVSWWISN